MLQKNAHISPYRLTDRYDLGEGRVFLTGTQALVRIMLDQARRDRQAGLNTAGFVSGYRGSPLGALDLEFWRIKDLLKARMLPSCRPSMRIWAPQPCLAHNRRRLIMHARWRASFHVVRQGTRPRPLR